MKSTIANSTKVWKCNQNMKYYHTQSFTTYQTKTAICFVTSFFIKSMNKFSDKTITENWFWLLVVVECMRQIKRLWRVTILKPFKTKTIERGESRKQGNWVLNFVEHPIEDEEFSFSECVSLRITFSDGLYMLYAFICYILMWVCWRKLKEQLWKPYF